MKKIYVSCPMPMTEEVINDLKSHLLKESGIEINPVFFDHELDNQTCVFEVNQEDEYAVVETIHELGDFCCFFDTPAFEGGKWINMYD